MKAKGNFRLAEYRTNLWVREEVEPAFAEFQPKALPFFSYGKESPMWMVKGD